MANEEPKAMTKDEMVTYIRDVIKTARMNEFERQNIAATIADRWEDDVMVNRDAAASDAQFFQSFYGGQS